MVFEKEGYKLFALEKLKEKYKSYKVFQTGTKLSLKKREDF